MSWPGYWPNETSGVLRPVVKRYLSGAELDGDEIVVMRTYLRQWVASPYFVGPTVGVLRARASKIATNEELRAWLADARDAGIDPL